MQQNVRRRGGLLAGLSFVVAAGVLIQAVLAGLFLPVSGAARGVHLIVGSLLPLVALALPVAAWSERRRGRASRRLFWAATALPFVLWVQEGLGHMPEPVTTAVHVPLGVSLLTYAVLLGLATRRAASEPRPELDRRAESVPAR